MNLELDRASCLHRFKDVYTAMGTIFGFIFGVILVITEKGGLCENVVVNRILDFLVNTIRSFPFIILLISIIPFTRLIVGTSIGETAALVDRKSVV